MGVKYCDSMSVCLSARLSQKPHDRTSPHFRARWLCRWLLWPWLGPPMMALRYVMYFLFCGWRHVSLLCGACVVCIPKRQKHNGQNYRIDSDQSLLDDTDSKYTSRIVHCGWRWLSTIALFALVSEICERTGRHTDILSQYFASIPGWSDEWCWMQISQSWRKWSMMEY